MIADGAVAWQDSLQQAFISAGDTLADLAFSSGPVRLWVEADSTSADVDSTGLGGVVVMRIATPNTLCGAIRPGASRLVVQGSNPTSAATIRLLANSAGTCQFLLYHRQANDEVVKLDYAPIPMEATGEAYISISVSSTEYPLYVDPEGDGFFNKVYYPGGTVVGVDEQISQALPVFLASPSPNPWTKETIIRFGHTRKSKATLSVFDARGRRIREWRWDELPAGPQLVRWDGRGDDGASVSAGVVFLRLDLNGQVYTTKTVILR
jgi:hypothetical protein